MFTVSLERSDPASGSELDASEKLLQPIAVSRIEKFIKSIAYRVTLRLGGKITDLDQGFDLGCERHRRPIWNFYYSLRWTCPT